MKNPVLYRKLLFLVGSPNEHESANALRALMDALHRDGSSWNEFVADLGFDSEETKFEAPPSEEELQEAARKSAERMAQQEALNKRNESTIDKLRRTTKHKEHTPNQNLKDRNNDKFAKGFR